MLKYEILLAFCRRKISKSRIIALRSLVINQSFISDIVIHIKRGTTVAGYSTN